MTADHYDTVSALSRPGVFRLNIGLTKRTFLSLFGARPARSGEADRATTGDDFTALDRLTPHPIYGAMFWVCVLNPSTATFQEPVRSLLAEAYELAGGRPAKRRPE